MAATRGVNPAVLRLLQDALALHRAGQFEAARPLYERVLQREPRNFDALNLLAKLNLSLGQGQAADLWLRALQVRPDFFEARIGAVQALEQAGKLPEAVAACQQALLLRPKTAELHFRLGLLLRALNRRAEAMAAYRRCLEVDPAVAEAWINLGCFLEEEGNAVESLSCFERAVSAQPKLSVAHYFLGARLRKAGQIELAERSLVEALRLQSNSPEALNELGTLCSAQRRFREAEDLFRRALAVRPNFIEAHNNLGNALRQQNRPAESVAALARALELAPRHAEILNNLGTAEQSRNQLESAIGWFRRSIEVAPDHAEAHVNLGLCLLTLGHLRDGWPEYDHRWRSDLRALRRQFGVPAWTGAESLRDRVILLHAEQGLGDSIQFLRYVPCVAALGAKVILEIQPELRSLVAGCATVHHLCARGDPLPPFDFHCPLLDLPRAFGTSIETVPSSVPYLNALPPVLERWQARLASLDRPRIGLVWSGNPKHKNDHNRSLPLELLLTALAGCRGSFVSLQKEPRSEDLARLRAEARITDLAGEMRDFHDTAAIVSQLDLVLTVDTSMAHLAGAVGCPTWVFLPYCPDWRWLLEREDSPWYPQMRLWRQESPGDWSAPLRRVREALLARESVCCPGTG
jgi:tetratricopeptide (TPR) repeat protein